MKTRARFSLLLFRLIVPTGEIKAFEPSEIETAVYIWLLWQRRARR
jgi:hypothetical protein